MIEAALAMAVGAALARLVITPISRAQSRAARRREDAWVARLVQQINDANRGPQ